ncbi:MAG: hypothetical protein ACR2OV_09315 [Hyphomicrobiaceae bacterium]
MAARMYIWPRYAIEVDGQRVRLSNRIGAAIARLFTDAGQYVATEELVDCVYYDDPEGGPLTADNCIAVNMVRVNQLLLSLPAYVEGCPWKGRRLVIK